MSGIYYTDLLTVLRNAGVTCQENDITAGWQSRARSSGGFPSAPLCVFWHHTASQTSPENDLNYMINGSPDRPVGNMLLDRNGVVWPVAAGASNCAGKGGPSSFSRGTIPLDSGNTRGWQVEIANNGVGEAWPQKQIDAMFKINNALNARFGNLPTDLITHALGAGDGYTSRKIDPATAAAVQGPWKPRSTNSSGTWNLADIRNEATRRNAPPVEPPATGPVIQIEDPMFNRLPSPKRAYDSRDSGNQLKPNEQRRILLAGTSGAVAVFANLTAISPAGTGWLKAWGDGGPPDASAITFRPNESITNGTIIPVDPDDGRIVLQANVACHVTIDLIAYWSP